MASLTAACHAIGGMPTVEAVFSMFYPYRLSNLCNTIIVMYVRSNTVH